MEKTIKIPIVGENIEEVEISQWFFGEGEEIKKGSPLLEVLVEKTIMEIESEFTGKILKILKEGGTIVNIGEEIAVIEVG